MERTGTGEPVRVIPLLWGRGVRASRSGLTLEAVVGAGLAVADELGVGQLSMRKIAERLGVSAMTLYAHVPGKAELIDLMVDRVFAEVRYDVSDPDPAGWRSAMESVAEANWQMLTRHPWLTDVDTTRPPLGPGTIAKYDAELRPFDGTGLDDVQIDQALTLVLDHVRSSARQAFGGAPAETGEGADGDWWREAGPVLAALLDPAEYPHAARIGAAAGREYGAPADHRRAYEFGLRTILDGIEGLIAEKA